MVMEDAESCGSRASEAFPASLSRQERLKVEVYLEVLRRLREAECEEANRPGFDDELWAHFNRLPVTYAQDVNVVRAQDVLMHKRLLHAAQDPASRPAVEVRPVQVHPFFIENGGGSIHSNPSRKGDPHNSDYLGWQRIHPPPAFGPSPSFERAVDANKSCMQGGRSIISVNQQLFRPLHEITFSTHDKPKLFCELASLLSEIGLNIQEAHAFSTTDGYSLDVFVVDGRAYEETEMLKKTLAKEIPRIEKQSCSKSYFRSADESEKMEMRLSPDCNEMLVERTDVWEIDPDLLEYEHKIVAGSSCDLFKGTFHGQDVAIKVVKAEYLSEDVQREFAQEVRILRKVRHKNVVQFVGACTKPPRLCIVTEFMAGGSVYDFLHNKKGHFKFPAMVRVAIDVSKGMDYLHHHKIVHRDLKAANLLLDENEVVKVADFGVARVQSPSDVMTAETGTYRWMAPEVIEHRPYNHKADIFSFGIVLWELLTGKLPYAHMTPLQAAVGVVQKGLRPKIPKNAHPAIVELLKRCWQHDPSSRPEFSEIIEILLHISET